MANLTDTAGCGCNGSTGTGAGVLLPASPFYAPRYHFGMLLGVDDFESEQAYHRGKGRLHNAWLHGEGVVWGFGVDLPDVEGRPGVPRGEIRVHPGFALDAAGRELHLDCDACLSVAAWYAAHKDDPEVVAAVREEAGVLRFDAHVVARFRACPARPVPSISEPCNGSGGDVAYSRTQETAELLLLPGAAPPRKVPYHRLRLLFALEMPWLQIDGSVAPGDQEVLDARAAVLALPPEDQPAAYLHAFRRFAAYDEMDLRPAALPDGGGTTLFPADDSCVVVLADVLRITVNHNAKGEPEFEFQSATVDNTVRPSHVATSTIQELLNGPLATCICGEGSPPVGSPPSSPPDSPPTSPPDSPPASPPDSPPASPPESPPESPPASPPDSPPDSPPESPPDSPPDSPPGGGASPPEESPPVTTTSPPDKLPPPDDVPPVPGPGDTFAPPRTGFAPAPPRVPPPSDTEGMIEWDPPRLMRRGEVFAAEYEGFPSRLPDTRDAGGPRIDPESIRLEGEAVVMAASKRLSKASVAPRAFSVSAYDLRDGWHEVEVRATRLDAGQRKLRLELATGFGGNLVRIIARGTGPAPLLGTDLVPLAGGEGGPPGGTENGHDFVIMLKRSET